MDAFEDRQPSCAVVSGMGATMRALGALVCRRAQSSRSGLDADVAPADPHEASAAVSGRRRPYGSAADGRALLEELGVPVVPGVVVSGGDDDNAAGFASLRTRSR